MVATPRPVWIALSDLYLDTEMQDSTHARIARTLKEEGISLAQAREIDKQEVFPVLYDNLLSVAGIWDLFPSEWLVEAITVHLARRNRIRLWWDNLMYALWSGSTRYDWTRIERYYRRMD